KRYLAPLNQDGLKLSSIIGYNGNGRENVIWHPQTALFAYKEISILALTNDVTVLASAQCSSSFGHDMQSQIIIWDIKSLKQKLSLQQSVSAINCMAFSRDD
ncbi:unnamed protein product, partial [Didymodactylos carnosus]